MSDNHRPADGPAIQRVSTVELFFDLVFVFAITQVTSLVVHPHGPGDYLRSLLVFLTLMWMYGGYTWLTSNVAFDRPWPRQLLMVAMAGFFTMALGIPEVFASGGLSYAVGYLTVIAIHAFLFTTAPTSSASAIRSIAGYNLAAAGFVLAAAFVESGLDWPLWSAAVAVFVVATLRRREAGFELSPAHFVERNGLLLIVALGESVVAVGLGARGLALDLPRVAAAVLSLLLSGAIWSTYFDGDDRRAELRFTAAAPLERARMAVLGFGYAHFVMIAGIILTAAGLEAGVVHPTGQPESAGVWNLAAGLAIYLAGDTAYRRILEIGPGRLRLLFAGLMPATLPVGFALGAMAQVAACLLLLYGLWLIERRSAAALRT